MLALHPPAPSDLPPAAPSDHLPLQSRIWLLYCQGYSQAAIGEQVGIERHAIARHIKAAEALLAAETIECLSLARYRALEAAYNLFAITLDKVEIEGHREDAIWREYEHALTGQSADRPPHVPEPPAARSDSSLPAVPVQYYRAGSARLLGIALAALRHAIRLSGLEDDTHSAIAPSVDLPRLLSRLPLTAPPARPTSPAASSASLGSLPAENLSQLPRARTPLQRPPKPPAVRGPSPAQAPQHILAPAACAAAAAPPAATPLSPQGEGPGVRTPNHGTKWNTPTPPPARGRTPAPRPRAPAKLRKRHGHR